jgi:proteic killer suppression protein
MMVLKYFLEKVLWEKELGGRCQKYCRQKLDMLYYAARSSDLKAPPANRLEQLKGEPDGYHSIRINDQWRIVLI